MADDVDFDGVAASFSLHHDDAGEAGVEGHIVRKFQYLSEGEQGQHRSAETQDAHAVDFLGAHLGFLGVEGKHFHKCGLRNGEDAAAADDGECGDGGEGQGDFQFAIVDLGRSLQQAIAQQHEFADQVHLVFEQADVHADGTFLLAAALVVQYLFNIAFGNQAERNEDFAQAAAVAVLLQLQSPDNFILCDSSLADEFAAELSGSDAWLAGRALGSADGRRGGGGSFTCRLPRRGGRGWKRRCCQRRSLGLLREQKVFDRKGGFLCRHQQLFQAVHQLAVLLLSFRLARADFAQDIANRVHHLEKDIRDALIQK